MFKTAALSFIRPEIYDICIFTDAQKQKAACLRFELGQHDANTADDTGAKFIGNMYLIVY